MSQIRTKFIENLAVTEAKLAANAVTEGKIASGAVTNAKVASGIDAVKIADGSVSNTEFQYLGNVTSDIQAQLDDKVDESLLGANNGVATLDAGGKVPASQLPNSVMEFQGQWNASTNTPTLADGTGNAGDVYRTDVAGTVDFGSGNITFEVGDWVMYSGTVWQKASNSNLVSSVNGQQGVVVLDTDDITEGSALYFTDERAQDAVGSILTDSARIDFTYDDVANTITADLIADSVNGSFIRLANDQFLRARNAANTADINILKVSADNAIEFASSIRLPNNTWSQIRNGANTAWVNAIRLSNADLLEIGDFATTQDVRIGATGVITLFSNSVNLQSTDISIQASGTASISGNTAVILSSNSEEIRLNSETLLQAPSLLFANSDNSEYLSLSAPGSLLSSYSLVLPEDAGSPGQVLTTDGSGILSWETAASTNWWDQVLPFNTYVRARNQSNTADVDIFKFQNGNFVVATSIEPSASGRYLGSNDTPFEGLRANVIARANDETVLDITNGRLLDSAGTTSIDFETRVMVDDSSNNSLNYQFRSLSDALGNLSVLWDDRELYDSSTTIAIDYEDRIIADSDGSLVLDFSGANLQLLAKSGTPRALSFFDSSSNSVGIRAPASVSSYTLTLPGADGSSGQVLSTNGSGDLSWITPSSTPAFTKQTIVLAAGDITNQYVDLSAEAAVNSISVLIRGAGAILEGASYEYSVSYTGGAGGVTRINFLNDIATGGASELIAGDVLQITFVEA